MSNGPRRPRLIRAATTGLRAYTQEIQPPTEVIWHQTLETEAPAEVIQAPTEVIEAPGEVIQAPAEVIQEPAEAIQEPAEMTRAPAEADQAPAEVIQAPVEDIRLQTPEVQAPAEASQPGTPANPPEVVENPPEEAEDQLPEAQAQPQQVQNQPQQAQPLPLWVPNQLPGAGAPRQPAIRDLDTWASLAGTRKLLLGHLDDIGTLRKLMRRLESSTADKGALKRVQIAHIATVLAESIEDCPNPNDAIMHKQVQALRTAITYHRDQTFTTIKTTSDALAGHMSTTVCTTRTYHLLTDQLHFFMGNAHPADQRANVLKLIEQVRGNHSTTSSVSTTSKPKTTSVEASVEAWTAVLESGTHLDAAVGSQLLHLLRVGLLSGESKRLWIQLGVSLHAALDQGAFWKGLDGIADADRALLLYFLAKRSG